MDDKPTSSATKPMKSLPGTSSMKDAQKVETNDQKFAPISDNQKADVSRLDKGSFDQSFTLKLVLVAATGSFLFGFNVSLLNTAISTISSDFQLCGRVTPGGEVVKRYNLDLATCQTYTDCAEKCLKTNSNGEQILKCPGGYTDIKCDRYEWLTSLLVCALLIGGAIGSLAVGRLPGFGRRYMLLVDCMIFAIGIISSVCANSFSAMFFSRLIVGIGVGIISVTSPTYISEVTPPNKRGYYGVFHQVAITVGILIGNVIGLPLINPNDHADNFLWVLPTFQRVWWRVMLGMGLIPVAVVTYLLVYHFKFETPVFYIEEGQYEEAKAVLRKIYCKENVDVEFEVTHGYVEEAQKMQKIGISPLSALRQPDYRMCILVGICLSGFQQLGGINVFMTSSNTFFRQAGLKATMQTYMSIIMSAINVVMTIPTIYLIETLGRKSLLMFGSFFQCAFLVPAAISYYFDKNLDDPAKVTQILSIIGIIGFVLSFAVAYGPILWVYLFEIYPIELKASASALATAVNWIAGIIIVFVGIILKSNKLSFTLFAALQFGASIFILLFMRESRGRALGDSPYISKKPDGV